MIQREAVKAVISPGEAGYRICTKTVMDTSDRRICFDSDGISNHYYEYIAQEREHVVHGDEGRKRLDETAQRIRRLGAGRKYDCILGLSGGVDSTYLCLLAKKFGLKPLVVHFDNGWNSELAVGNIENTVSRLGFDLYTYVCDWMEFRELQRSYFAANVVDIEVLTDHAFMATLYQQALKHRIKFVLGGMNCVTEAILPSDWIYNKNDLVNIKGIQNRFGERPFSALRSFPSMGPDRRLYIQRAIGVEVLSPLNWLEYRYDQVKEQIQQELGWRDYGGKHYESVFTRFYQGYILPNKFRIDKRRAHYSTLICSGQMTRDDAKVRISESGYDARQCQQDLPFVLKKLGFSAAEFEAYLQAPRVEHEVYGVERGLYARYPWLGLFKRVLSRFIPKRIG
ncbi:MAG: N-acetyl sugar amidotransferase [Planctomycetes bacterium]|nr:N-acetyl sugar amidotransferase [Planctomycetota bacterium]